MGYLTTITCYNDGKDELLQHSEAFAEQICDVMENRFTRYFPITLRLRYGIMPSQLRSSSSVAWS
jgi:hypothetical protein